MDGNPLGALQSIPSQAYQDKVRHSFSNVKTHDLSYQCIKYKTAFVPQVLREVVHCTLPVEMAWLGDQEMDDNTLAALQQRFGPLTGFNAQAVAFPSHHRE